MRELVLIGMGHIGGSVAAGARDRALANRVVGVEADPAARITARASRLADVITGDLAEACAKADLVVVAVPPASTVEMVVAALAAGPRAVVTDVAGLKRAIVEGVGAKAGAAASRFVGGHPMAGTAGSGPASAQADLFDGRKVVVTPLASTDPAALAVVEGFWRGLGAHTLREQPEAHDLAVTAVSHLPHLMAWALIEAAAGLLADGNEAAGAARAAAFAGPSFAGATRVAASDPAMWQQLLLENRSNVLAALQALQARLSGLGDALLAEEEQPGVLLELLRRAQTLALASSGEK